jgi:ADP-ribose pyrophosphatase
MCAAALIASSPGRHTTEGVFTDCAAIWCVEAKPASTQCAAVVKQPRAAPACDQVGSNYTAAMTIRTHPLIPPTPDTQIDSQQRVWDGRFPIDVVHFRHRRFDGALSGERIWELWRRGRAAAVLPWDPDTDQVVLIEQYRLPALAAGINPVLVELPAGLCDDGEAPETTARREMLEEVALPVTTLHPIGEFLLTPGGADELCALYLGRVTAPPAGPDGVAGTAGLASENEDIRVRVWPAVRAIEDALAGRFPNIVTTLGLLWLAARHAAMRTAWRTP